ncbi:MAG: hypothetical protein ACR2GH_04345 [Pseudonocardia sp.]
MQRPAAILARAGVLRAVIGGWGRGAVRGAVMGPEPSITVPWRGGVVEGVSAGRW